MTSFKVNNAGFRAMANGPEIRKALVEVAEKAKGIAEGLAQNFRVTGDYADSFDVQNETIEWTGRYSGPRAAVRLANTSEHAAAVEFGNEGVTVYRSKATQRFVSPAHANDPGVEQLVVNFPAHRVLGRTLDALGD